LVNNNVIIGITSGNGKTLNTGRFVRVDNPAILDWIKDSVKKRLGVNL